jgi:GNAT superfamily N-acetyltransferase
MSVTIRDAAPADVATILRFIRELAEFEREADKVVATEALLHDAMFGERPVAEAVIAEDLYVTPEARGSGVGGALLRHLAGIAVDRGCTRFEWSVLDWNKRAIEFYRSMGAEAMNEWTVNRVSGAALARLAGRG